ncbi:MAG: L-aspartate oxidase [bacterium]
MLYDVIIVGSGVAGLNTARNIDPKLKVALITKTKIGNGSSILAQGGIAAVSSKNEDDDFAAHIQDTLRVGAGLCHEDIVNFCVKHGPDAIKDLIKIGVDFSLREINHNYDLTKEGGHSHRRIYHSGDITGESMVQCLVADVRKRSNVTIFEDHVAINLIVDDANRACGVYALDDNKKKIKTFMGGALVLATGGAGKAYLYTSNPDEATGDGIAMAYRAGAEISNMEFFQFHPTCLYHPDAKNFLISEAVRGEGGVLRLKSGERFMRKYDDKKMELAPRDVVARAIDKEMKRTGADCVYLDVTDLDENFIRNRFPNIYERCLKIGVDMTSQWIPVVPAAHYCCGGVKVDIHGKTTMDGLFAVGECACTGLHGANRLASNSLLEAMVFSKVVGHNIKKHISGPTGAIKIPEWESSWARIPEETILIHNNWDELRMTMWNNVGIVRSLDRLRNALKRIEIIKAETESYYWRYELTKDLIELRNIVTVAETIVVSAMSRKESRGLHYINNFPDPDESFLRDTILKK